MADKFPEELRNFETRLLFLHELFSNLFSQTDIMAHCVEHKLGRSFLAYSEELRRSTLYLNNEDPLKILKKIK